MIKIKSAEEISKANLPELTRYSDMYSKFWDLQRYKGKDQGAVSQQTEGRFFKFFHRRSIITLVCELVPTIVRTQELR